MEKVKLNDFYHLAFSCPACNQTMRPIDEEDKTFSCDTEECPIAIVKVMMLEENCEWS